MAVINFKDTSVSERDPANQEMMNRVSSKTINMPLFTTQANAKWIADRLLKAEAWTPGIVSFSANRNVFRLTVGSPFVLGYEQYGISGEVYRVTRIEEASLESEEIVVYAVEDINYNKSSEITELVSEVGKGEERSEIIEALSHTAVFEAPYVLVQSETIKLVTLAGRQKTSDIGYIILFSTGGSTYSEVARTKKFSIHGTLLYDYTDIERIDDDNGFYVTFDNDDVDLIETITRVELFGNTNLALLGSEIISFQTITPISGYIYKLTGVYRGRYDTERVDHTAGESFWFLGTKYYEVVECPDLSVGGTRYTKYNPFNSKYTGSEADANANSIVIAGRCRKPYEPLNFRANGGSTNPLYTGDILLIWTPRKRGGGADSEVDYLDYEKADWEGWFEIEVWVNGSLKRTASGIDSTEWTYTETLNLADNGSLPDQITFKLKNYRELNGITYSSDQVTLVVNKE